ncbi:DUF4249 domain-containing protein [Pedobacter frigidisoli]|uniref:DUF4249 domain-containing protein n=1 Tax=Pedobacter frigidisoli TaxID=2530455 RepID=A0A4R0P080_9SPHI|nr:DUF4249 domain-containing protein [Pedobacter frigidisoli]TCD05586.1 DUF4249 domain-containing protein [Pedobacter frigidisoli]
MKNYNNSILFVLTIGLLCLTACEEVIDLKLDDASGQLVIEGSLTNASGPQMVKLTKNIPFTSTNIYPPVIGAVVTVQASSGVSFPLIEGPAGTYTVNGLAGAPGSTYTLIVKSGGHTYSAASTMPNAVALDSLTSKDGRSGNTGGGNISVRKVVTAHYQDPPGVKNQYLFLVYVNGVQVKNVFAYDDNLTDGSHVGADLRQSDIDVYVGDTVKVEMLCIDKQIYTYWFALQQQDAHGPSGSTAPANPPTNISPAALGYFSAHTIQTKTIVVK